MDVIILEVNSTVVFWLIKACLLYNAITVLFTATLCGWWRGLENTEKVQIERSVEKILGAKNYPVTV